MPQESKERQRVRVVRRVLMTTSTVPSLEKSDSDEEDCVVEELMEARRKWRKRSNKDSSGADKPTMYGLALIISDHCSNPPFST